MTNIKRGIISEASATTTMNRIGFSMSSLIDDLEKEDLKEVPATSLDTDSQSSANDNQGLKDIINKKLSFLKTKEVIESDAMIKFKLQEEIEKLQKQLDDLD